MEVTAQLMRRDSIAVKELQSVGEDIKAMGVQLEREERRLEDVEVRIEALDRELADMNRKMNANSTLRLWSLYRSTITLALFWIKV